MNDARSQAEGGAGLLQADSIRAALGYGAFAQAAMRSLGFLRAVFLAWLLPEAQFGLMGTAVLMMNVLLPVVTLGLHEGVARYAEPAQRAGRLPGFIGRVVGVVLLGTLGFALLALSFPAWLSDLAFSSSALSNPAAATSAAECIGLIRATAAALGTLAFFHIALGCLRGLRRFLLFNLLDVLAATGFTLLAIAVAWAAPWAQAVLWCYAAANALALAVVLGAIARARSGERSDLPDPPLDRDRKGTREALFGRILGFSLHSASAALAWQFLLFYPAWHVMKSTDAANAGRFYTVRLMGQLLQYLSIPLAQILYGHALSLWHAPAVSCSHAGPESETGRRLAIQTRRALLALLAAVAAAVWIRPILERIFPESLRGTAGVFQAFVALYAAQGVVTLISVRIQLVERASDLSQAWLVGAGATVVAGLLLLGQPGMPGPLGPARFLELAALAGVAGPAFALIWVVGGVQRGPLPLTRAELLLAGLFLPPLLGPGPTTAAFALAGFIAWRRKWF